MTISKDVIRELAQLAQSERTVLSVYLDLTKGWDSIKHFVKKESRRILPLLESQEKDYFEASISFLSDYLNEEKNKGFRGPGIAFFADLGADYTRGVELVVVPEPLIAVDVEAIIHPLALQLDEYEPIGIIMIDAACTRILIAAGQVIEGMDSFCKKIHHLSKVGGWSQMRYQRRRTKQVKHFVKEVIEKAKEVFDEAGVRRIICAGRDRMITAIEKEWPKAWRDKIIATVRWDLDAPDVEFLHKIRPILEQTERLQEKDLLAKLVAELKRGGLAVTGIDDTIKALRLGQVDTLLVNRGVGFKDLEELTSLAQSTGANVEFVPEGNKTLEVLGGIGALLRFKIRS